MAGAAVSQADIRSLRVLVEDHGVGLRAHTDAALAELLRYVASLGGDHDLTVAACVMDPRPDWLAQRLREDGPAET